MSNCHAICLASPRGHDVRTVQQQGWAGLKNGELLRRAAVEAFEVFLTADQNLSISRISLVLRLALSY
jgi:hypothetical protein